VKKKIDMVTLILFLVALASIVAAAKGFGHHPGKGFFSGG
jgi:hypothetical protein